METRQQVLIVHLENSSLDSRTIGWAFFDGSAPESVRQQQTGDEASPPYASVLAALRDGWKLVQIANTVVVPGREHATSALPYEFVLTREAACHE